MASKRVIRVQKNGAKPCTGNLPGEVSAQSWEQGRFGPGPGPALKPDFIDVL